MVGNTTIVVLNFIVSLSIYSEFMSYPYTQHIIHERSEIERGDEYAPNEKCPPRIVRQ